MASQASSTSSGEPIINAAYKNQNWFADEGVISDASRQQRARGPPDMARVTFAPHRSWMPSDGNGGCPDALRSSRYPHTLGTCQAAAGSSLVEYFVGVCTFRSWSSSRHSPPIAACLCAEDTSLTGFTIRTEFREACMSIPYLAPLPLSPRTL